MLKITKAKVRSLIPSVVTSEMHITGGIIGEGAIEIAGKVDGDIRCRSVLVNEGGLVGGDIIAEQVKILGQVNGSIIGKSVVCGQTAKVLGKIKHQSLHIETGAAIEGACTKHQES